jgi:hypothetical protein
MNNREPVRGPENYKAALAVVVSAVLVIASLGFATRPAAATRLGRTVWDSVYSAPQAGRGESAYARSCARCHGATLSGANEAPPLAGSGFLGNWNGLALNELQNRIQTTMPSDSVGIYNRTLVVTVMAYLLKANGFPAGTADLPESVDSLKGIMLNTSKP